MTVFVAAGFVWILRTMMLRAVLLVVIQTSTDPRRSRHSVGIVAMYVLAKAASAAVGGKCLTHDAREAQRLYHPIAVFMFAARSARSASNTNRDDATAQHVDTILSI